MTDQMTDPSAVTADATEGEAPPAAPESAPAPKKRARKPKSKAVNKKKAKAPAKKKVKKGAKTKVVKKTVKKKVKAKKTAPPKEGRQRRAPGTNPPHSKETAAYGKKVAKARVAKGWTQGQLAAKIGYSQPGVCNLERGISGCKDTVKAKIQKVLGVKP